jgi:hypothetical protein
LHVDARRVRPERRELAQGELALLRQTLGVML